MPKKFKRRGGMGGAGKQTSAGPAGNASASASSSKAYPPQPNTLIMAIDFGTTYSGVAWHNTASGKTHILRDWELQNLQSSNKVPTVLRYSKKGIQWGAGVRAAPDRLEWFKLLLNEPEYSSYDELLCRLEKNGLNGYAGSSSTHLAELRTTIKAIPADKTPADLAADYLRELYKYAKLKLGQSYPTLKEDLGRAGGVTIKCCLTVPAIWDDEAKELTKQAAMDAGITEKEIYMISEPEAAAVHALTDLDGVKGNLKVGDVYVIVDCGGGTVDLISYKVTSIDPQLRVSECNVGSGGLCGSTVLNRRFEGMVIRRIGQQAYDNMEEDDRTEMLNDFNTKIKLKFFPDNGSGGGEHGGDDDDNNNKNDNRDGDGDGEGDGDDDGDVDDDCDDDDGDDDDDDGQVCLLPGVPDDPTKGVRRRKITFSTKDMKEIFEQTFKEITWLVQAQVTAAQEVTKTNVDAMILVGGFGSSNYLARWLEDNVRNKDGTKVKLIRPLDPSTAIVLGAVQHGLHQHEAGNTSSWGIVESRKSRYNYGIRVSEVYRPHIHPHLKRYTDPYFGIPMCKGRMKWIIRKGDDMVQGVGKEEHFHRRCPIARSEEAQKLLLTFNEDIYASAEDIAPDGDEDPSVRKLLTYTTNLMNVPRRHFTSRWGTNGVNYWDIPATISVTLDSADLIFTTLVLAEPYGEGRKLYHHKDLSEKRAGSPTRQQKWKFCPYHGTVHVLDDDKGNQIGDEVEDGLATLNLCGHGH
ncbi:hypothetical protein BGX38DRAFT_122554 [Terfezia claveryi]|nr:hypothetical protein BGX38DRAFT_122554 [Terfezia claveryi]